MRTENGAADSGETEGDVTAGSETRRVRPTLNRAFGGWGGGTVVVLSYVVGDQKRVDGLGWVLSAGTLCDLRLAARQSITITKTGGESTSEESLPDIYQ